MKDLFVVDAFQCHPIAAPLRLACSEPVPLQGISWLQDEFNNPEYLLVLVTLWDVYRYARHTLCMNHSDVCPRWYARMTRSLLKPELFQHIMVMPNATRHPSFPSSSSPSMMLSWPLSSDSEPTPTSIRSIWTPPFDVSERLTSAWPSHPMHAFVPMSPGPDAEARHHEDPPRLRTCGVAMIGSRTDWTTRACVVVVEVMGGGGASRGESVGVAWLVDTHAVILDDGECNQPIQNFHATSGCAGLWRDASPSRTRTARELDECVDVLGLAVCSVAWHSGLDDTCQPRPRRVWKQSATVLRDPHEAHGVGVIIKALVQQNAGASLFLRAIAYIAALLGCVHSMLVLGKGSPLIGCRKS